METAVYEDLLRYKTTQAYPADVMKAFKRHLHEKSESFVVKENMLYHKSQTGKEQRVVQRYEVAELDASVDGGYHFAINVTQKKISERHWWSTMSEDICHLIRTSLDTQLSTLLWFTM